MFRATVINKKSLTVFIKATRGAKGFATKEAVEGSLKGGEKEKVLDLNTVRFEKPLVIGDGKFWNNPQERLLTKC